MRAPIFTIRKAALYLVGVMATMVIIGPIGEFFIELARERGLYDSPGRTLARVSGIVGEIVASYPFGVVAGLIVGFAGGVWLDAILKRKAAQPGVQERFALADRAETLASQIGPLVGQLQTAQDASSTDRSSWDHVTDSAERSRLFHASQSKISAEKARVVERFTEKYLNDYLDVVECADRLIKIDDQRFWHMRNHMRVTDLGEVVAFLRFIIAELRLGRGVLPPAQTINELIAKSKKKAADAQHVE